jgi:hypothetical protein
MTARRALYPVIKTISARRDEGSHGYHTVADAELS